MKKTVLTLMLLAGIVLAFALPAMAAEDSGARAAASGWDEAMQKFHQPADWITLGADFRARYVYSGNIETLSAETDKGDQDANMQYSRNRTRLWGTFHLEEDLDFNFRVVNEWRIWCDPDGLRNNQFDEIFLDRFNITWRNAFDMPLTLVVGRQDISLGHRWLVFDGTQGDGSRTIYFDAIRATYTMEEWDATLDLMYINQLANQRNRIKPINDRDRLITYEDTSAVIVYGSKKFSDKMKGDAYFIYREDNAQSAALSEDADFYTFGGLVDGFIDDDKTYQYYAEGAIQFGNKGQRDMNAYGVNTKFTYHRNDEWHNCFGLSFEYLSGDDPGSTDENEAFDPMWGAWPQFSELLIYTWRNETSIAEITNMYRLGLHWTFRPQEKLDVLAAMHLLWADENTRGGLGSLRNSNVSFDENADFRGQLYTLWFKYNHNANWKGHLVMEYFCPGAYYELAKSDSAMFLRLNVEYTF